MAEWTIPPGRLPEEPYTLAQYECYVDKYAEFLNHAKQCIQSGGTQQEVQACIDQHYANYLAYLPVCDTL